MPATALAASYATIGGLLLGGVEDSGVEWILESVTGWGAPQGTLAPVQKPRQAGAWAGTSYARARPLVLKGVTRAPDAATASDAIDRLNAACSLDPSALSIVESGRTRYVNACRDGEVLISWLNQNAFVWSVQFVALDPRKFAADLAGSTNLPASSGGLTVPYTVPFTIASTFVSGQVALFNPGNETGPVMFTIYGPVRAPSITHLGSALALTFSSSLVLNTGEFLVVDNEARQVLANGQASRSAFVTSRGWSGFEPGLNVWAFSAASFDAGAQLTVTATPAWK